MTFQKDINYKMRAILVDWLIDAHFQLNMKKETLFQCVFFIDAYLYKIIIERKNLQVLGIAALLIACKENEITYSDLLNWQSSLSSNAPSTINLKISAIKSYFKYLKKVGEINNNPAEDLEKVRNNEKVRIL